MKSEKAIKYKALDRQVYFLKDERYMQGLNRFMWSISPLIRTKHEFINGFLRTKSSHHVKHKLLQPLYGMGNILNGAGFAMMSLIILPFLFFIGLPLSTLLTFVYWMKDDPTKPEDGISFICVKTILSIIIECLFLPVANALYSLSLLVRGSIQIITTPLALTIQPLWQWGLTKWKGGYRTFAEKSKTQALVKEAFKEMQDFVISLMNQEEKAMFNGEGLPWYAGKRKKSSARVSALNTFVDRLTAKRNQEQTVKDINYLIKAYKQKRSMLKQWFKPKYTLSNLFNELVLTAHKTQANEQGFGKGSANLLLSLQNIATKEVFSGKINNCLKPEVKSFQDSNTRIQITMVSDAEESPSTISYKKSQLPSTAEATFSFFKHFTVAAGNTLNLDKKALENAMNAIDDRYLSIVATS